MTGFIFWIPYRCHLYTFLIISSKMPLQKWPKEVICHLKGLSHQEKRPWPTRLILPSWEYLHLNWTRKRLFKSLYLWQVIQGVGELLLGWFSITFLAGETWFPPVLRKEACGTPIISCGVGQTEAVRVWKQLLVQTCWRPSLGLQGTILSELCLLYWPLLQVSSVGSSSWAQSLCIRAPEISVLGLFSMCLHNIPSLISSSPGFKHHLKVDVPRLFFFWLHSSWHIGS